MAMQTHVQIALQATCGASCLMMAGHDAGHGTVLSVANEIVIHTACSLPPNNLGCYCLPGRLADYAVNTIGFANAEIILSGNLFNQQLLAQYGATPGCFPVNPAIPVNRWQSGLWSPRYMGTGAQDYYLMAVICVDNTFAKLTGSIGCSIGGYLWKSGSGFLASAVVGSSLGVGWLADLAIGMGLTGNANMTLHWILYHHHSYTDPHNGSQYWTLSRMGGANRTYWDTGVYIHLW